MPPFLAQTSYNAIIKKCIVHFGPNCHEKNFKKVIEEEIDKACKKKDIEDTSDMTMSGDDTWKKCGFILMYRISSLAGYYTRKL